MTYNESQIFSYSKHVTSDSYLIDLVSNPGHFSVLYLV